LNKAVFPWNPSIDKSWWNSKITNIGKYADLSNIEIL